MARELTQGEIVTLRRLAKKDGSRLTDNVMALINLGLVKTSCRSEWRVFKRRTSSLNNSRRLTDVTIVKITDAGRRYLAERA